MGNYVEIKFRRDTAFRKQFFVPDSFAHPAKMDAQLLIWCVERYTQAGENILDPMAGSGTTMLACGLGRNCILVELEEKFCKMMRDNWEEVRMRPQLGYSMGECQIIQGDVRQLEGLLVDKIISSPPYEGTESRDRSVEASFEREKSGKYPKRGDLNISKGYSVDSIITSPPYEEGFSRRHKSTGVDDRLTKAGCYQIDGIITSPPYENQGQGQGKEYHPEKMVDTETGLGRGYSGGAGNIGNLKSDSYLSAMLQVYQQCYSVLKPRGLMILVTKNFIRQKKVIRLDLDTIKLCEQAGFTYLERHDRKLSSQSFWRVIYHQKHPEVEQINHEDVLIFQR